MLDILKNFFGAIRVEKEYISKPILSKPVFINDDDIDISVSLGFNPACDSTKTLHTAKISCEAKFWMNDPTNNAEYQAFVSKIKYEVFDLFYKDIYSELQELVEAYRFADDLEEIRNQILRHNQLVDDCNLGNSLKIRLEPINAVTEKASEAYKKLVELRNTDNI